MNSEKIIKDIEQICQEGGKFIRENFNKITDSDIIVKEKNSLVSYVDQEAEIMITSKLSTLLPEAGFLTEEGTVKNSDKSFRWIVDPLDGTTNFIAGIPHFSISIALEENSDILLGAVYNVMTDDFYHAIKGKGAFVNGNAIKVSETERLDNAIIATGFPYDKSRISESLQKILLHYVTKSRALRRLGSAALDLCFTAQGTFDLYYETTLNPWDIAAGILIVEEAGGKVNDFNGNRDYLSNGEVIAAGMGMNNEVKWIIDNWLQK
ncbi:MAG: inositol monophosphatase family protein [Saprospiraceae bacterium]